jgi:hypothetical protein
MAISLPCGGTLAPTLDLRSCASDTRNLLQPLL